MLKEVFRRFREDENVSSLMLVFGMQAFSLLLSIAFSLLVSNRLGAEGYGVYGFAFSLVNLFALVGCLGYPQLSIRELPELIGRNEQGRSKTFIRFASNRVLLASVLLAGAVFLFSVLFEWPHEKTLRSGLWIALPALPLTALITLRLSILRAYGFPSLSQIPDKVLRPVLLLLPVVLVFLFGNAGSITFIMLTAFTSVFVSYLLSEYLLHKKVLIHLKGVPADSANEEWSSIAFSMLLINGVYVYLAQLPILLLGSLGGAEQTGVYAIASRLSDLEGYLLFAMNVVITPRIALLYSQNKQEKLQKLLTSSLRRVFILSFPVVALFLALPEFFLGLFGEEFTEGKTILVILTLSQLFNLATGSVGYMLTLTGHQSTALRWLIAAALFSTVGNYVMIKLYAGLGAAIATGSTMILLNAIMAIMVFRKTGMNSTLFTLKW